MKSNRGVTLTSLIIYIIGLIIIVGILNTFVGYFFHNINEVVLKDNSQEQYLNFLAYLTKDTNSDKITSLQVSTDGTYVIMKFEDNIQHQYIYKNEKIYYLVILNDTVEKKITLCKSAFKVSEKIFDYQDGNIQVNFKLNEDIFSKNLKVNIKANIVKKQKKGIKIWILEKNNL